jgi:hypothetical protein
LASQVITSTLPKPRSAARASMNSFWVRELETAVMRALGKLEDVLAVLQLGPLASECQHRGFRFVQAGDARTVVARGILEVLAEHALEKGAGHFVVLLVRLAGRDRHRARAQFPDERHQVRLLRRGVILAFLAQPRGKQLADAEADQEIGQPVPLEQLEGE